MTFVVLRYGDDSPYLEVQLSGDGNLGGRSFKRCMRVWIVVLSLHSEQDSRVLHLRIELAEQGGIEQVTHREPFGSGPPTKRTFDFISILASLCLENLTEMTTKSGNGAGFYRDG